MKKCDLFISRNVPDISCLQISILFNKLNKGIGDVNSSNIGSNFF